MKNINYYGQKITVSDEVAEFLEQDRLRESAQRRSDQRHPNQKTPDADITYISRLCDQNNVPFASNLATAEMLVLGLDRGDLDWRDIVNPKNKPFTA